MLAILSGAWRSRRAQMVRDLVDEVIEPLARFIALLPVTLVLGPELAHRLTEVLALALRGLEPIPQLLVLVRDATEPLVLALGGLHTLPQALVHVQELCQDRELGQVVKQRSHLGLAGVEPAPDLAVVPSLFGLDTDHLIVSFRPSGGNVFQFGKRFAANRHRGSGAARGAPPVDEAEKY
jgi:hypothetical protein